MNDPGLFVIGDEDAIFGFGLIGIEGQAVHSPDEARRQLDRAMIRPDLHVVFITDEWSQALGAEIDRLRTTVEKPLIVEISGSRQNAERLPLRARLRQVLGVRLEF